MMKVALDAGDVFVHTGGTRFDSHQTVVVLIHGAGQDHSVWRHQTRALAHRGFSACAIDLPGHGRSEGPALETITEMAGWLLDLLDALEVRSAVLVGHSMGSLVSIEAAAAAPERAAGLVLCGTTIEMSVHPELLAAARAGDRHAVDLIVGWSHTGQARRGGNRQPGTWERGVTQRLLEREIRSLGSDLEACAGYRASAHAAQVIAPVLVLAGTADRMTPVAGARSLAAMLPDVEVIELGGTGHDLVVERPRQVLDAIIAISRRAFG